MAFSPMTVNLLPLKQLKFQLDTLKTNLKFASPPSDVIIPEPLMTNHFSFHPTVDTLIVTASILHM